MFSKHLAVPGPSAPSGSKPVNVDLSNFTKIPFTRFLRRTGKKVGKLTLRGLNDHDSFKRFLKALRRLSDDFKFSELKVLDLSENNLGVAKFGTLCFRFLSRMPNLTELNLENNQITNRGIHYLVLVDLKLPKLTELNLTNNDITHKGASAILSSGYRKSLKVLDLSNNNIYDEWQIPAGFYEET